MLFTREAYYVITIPVSYWYASTRSGQMSNVRRNIVRTILGVAFVIFTALVATIAFFMGAVSMFEDEERYY